MTFVREFKALFSLFLFVGVNRERIQPSVSDADWSEHGRRGRPCPRPWSRGSSEVNKKRTRSRQPRPGSKPRVVPRPRVRMALQPPPLRLPAYLTPPPSSIAHSQASLWPHRGRCQRPPPPPPSPTPPPRLISRPMSSQHGRTDGFQPLQASGQKTLPTI